MSVFKILDVITKDWDSYYNNMVATQTIPTLDMLTYRDYDKYVGEGTNEDVNGYDVFSEWVENHPTYKEYKDNSLQHLILYTLELTLFDEGRYKGAKEW